MVTRSRRAWARRLTTVVVLVGMAGMSAHGQDLPTGRQIVDWYVEAIGGEAAWRRLTSVRATGTTELPAQGVRGTFEMISARPARAVMRMTVEGIGQVEQGTNGEIAWMLDPLTGPALVTGAPLQEMKNDAHFDAALHPSDLVQSVVTTARAEFDGRPAYKVVVTYHSGQIRDEYFDVETGLLLGTEGTSETPMGTLPIRITLRDYRMYDGIRQPSRMVQSAMGIDQHFVVETVELNTVKPEALDPPAVIRALIKTEPWKAEALASFDEAWSTIAGSFYDPTFGGRDWDGVRASLRPRVAAADSPDVARAVIREMLASLNLSHFALMSYAAEPGNAPVGPLVVPIDLRVIGDDIVVTQVADGSDAARAGLAPGQVLLGVDAFDVASAVAATDGVDARVALRTAWSHAQRALYGTGAARVRVRDGDTEREVKVSRGVPAGERVVFGHLPPFQVRVTDRQVQTASRQPVGVIGFNVWMASAGPSIEAAIDRHRNARGLVLDLRGNPGGLAGMIGGVAGHLMTDRAVLGRMKTRDADLRFEANPRLVMPDGRRVEPFGGPVALLVDELTASASECFAGGLQSLGRVRVFGRTTAGAVLPASTRRLSNGDLLMYVVGDFVTGTGQRLEGVGVVPDEPVSLDPGVLRLGIDPDLEAALRWLDQVLTP